MHSETYCLKLQHGRFLTHLCLTAIFLFFVWRYYEYTVAKTNGQTNKTEKKPTSAHVDNLENDLYYHKT